MSRPIVYVGGPMTAKTSNQWANNCMAGLNPSVEIMAAGAAVHCPLLQGLFMERDFTYGDIIKLDLAILFRCDILYLCAGWQHSRGAKREKAEAEKRNIPVYTGRAGLEKLLDKLVEGE